MIVLSHVQMRPLLAARRAGAAAASVSLDLNRTESEVTLEADGAIFPDGQRLAWASLEEIADSENACFTVENGAARKVQFYSEEFERFASLYPTEGAPTMLLASFPMHRIKGVDPQEDTRRKMQTIAPVSGRVLDVCTGLGYTAIAAAQTASEVLTLELDPTALEVAKRNPWSQELFANPRIAQRIGDAAEILPALPDGSFQRIFHDPPTFRLAGDLYSEAFYRQLFRVLQRGGRLFHYIGDLDSPHGRSVTKGAMRRLQDAGFQRVTKRPEAFGITAAR